MSRNIIFIFCEHVRCSINGTELEEFYLLGYNAVQSVESEPTFRRKFRLHFQGRKISQARNQRESR
jgi:hypothetical protein